MEKEQLLKLFAEYLAVKAAQIKATVRLWETDAEKFGTDAEGIQYQNGIAEGYELALRDFKDIFLNQN